MELPKPNKDGNRGTRQVHSHSKYRNQTTSHIKPIRIIPIGCTKEKGGSGSTKFSIHNEPVNLVDWCMFGEDSGL